MIKCIMREVNQMHCGRSPRKDCCLWLWLIIWKPQWKSLSESSKELFVGQVLLFWFMYFPIQLSHKLQYGGGGEGGRTNQTALKWSIIWMDPKFSIDFMKLYKFLLIIYYIHFEITGYPISLISSLWCNLFTNGTNPIISVWQRQLLQLFTNQLSPESVDYL